MSRDAPEEPKQLSVSDAREWLAQEIRDLDKARELRVKEATGIVDAFERGELKAKEAYQRMNAYEDRWGEALPGTSALPNMSDDEILARINHANASDRERWNNMWRSRHGSSDPRRER